ncbi:amidase [Aestuariivirga sp.]|uniref:amidase n=1 Tax=Aestuariivirga sp. TaxID=2650926 RepID=UPI0035935FE9
MANDAALIGASAVELRDRIASGVLRAVELAQALVSRINACEDTVQAWEWFDADLVMKQARERDAYRASGRPIGPLHGLPVALKDVIDTTGIPTANGTVLDAGRMPTRDAAVVERLKAAGAIIMGKTVTAELAFMAPGKTRNPSNPNHTPGGSSSGSAAAVAAGMVPLAVGTQTGGSVIRPAAFCGVVGFKPSFGTIPRTGILAEAPSLDTIGVFAHSVADASLLAETLFGWDALDKATAPVPFPALLKTALQKPPVKPVFAFVRTPFWDRADEDNRLALEELAERLGEQCFEAELPPAFTDAPVIRERIHFAEMAKCYYPYVRRGENQLSDILRAAIGKGNAIQARDYIAALDWPDVLYAGLGEIFDRCDAILTPASFGSAPATLASTGDPLFNGTWTMCGTPAVTIPAFVSDNGLPMGVQLVGRRGDDGRLLRNARWLAEFIETAE